MIDWEGQRKNKLSVIFRVSYMKYKEIKRINVKKKTELSKNWHLAPSLKGKQYFFKNKIK